MSPSGEDPLLFFNGIRLDGRYSQAPLSEGELIESLLGQQPDWTVPEVPDPRGIEDPTRRPRYGVNTKKLEESGWGVIFPAGGDTRIKRALRDLRDWRCEQAGTEREQRYREMVVHPGESAEAFLKRYRAPLAVANPDKVPYYLLIVGDPREISFDFQFGLEQVYATGRLHFDRLEDYECYARNVIQCEKRRRMPSREVVLFGVKNTGDPATQRTSEQLLGPLADHLSEQPQPPWSVQRIEGADATWDKLQRLLGGEDTPALLFTASHGMELEVGHELQYDHQGAILCNDWPGPDHEVAKDYYLAAEDISDDADLRGLIAFHFACYSAGTPELDTFYPEGSEPERIAPHPFVARLPQRLLSRPRGGALAVIGHVDRAWTTSFSWSDETGQPEVFESGVRCLLDGEPVGAAMEYFDQLQADTATRLNSLWERKDSMSSGDKRRFARLRVANRDARSFLVLGDPAVRLGMG